MHSSSLRAEFDALDPERVMMPTEKTETPTQCTVFRRMREGIHRNVQLLLLALVIDTVNVLTVKVEQPTALPPRSEYYQPPFLQKESMSDEERQAAKQALLRTLPPANAPIETIIDSLDSNEKYALFLQTHASYHLPKCFVPFIDQYASSPAELQKNNWTASCSTFAEFACEVGARHGKNMHLALMKPLDECFEQAKPDDKPCWHVVAFYKEIHPDGSITTTIFSNMVVYTKYSNIAAYCCDNEYHPAVVARWSRSPSDYRARIARYAWWNTIAEDSVIPTQAPIQKPPPEQMLYTSLEDNNTAATTLVGLPGSNDRMTVKRSTDHRRKHTSALAMNNSSVSSGDGLTIVQETLEHLGRLVYIGGSMEIDRRE